MTFVSLTRIKELQQESSRLIKEFGYKYLLEISFQELKKQKSILIKNIKSTATEHLNKVKAGLPNDHT